jgi:hypothetical protein
MKLPDILHGTWNAADFAEEVLRIGEDYRIFHELIGKTVPSELMIRCFGALSLRLNTLELRSDDGEGHLVQIKSVSTLAELTLVRRFEPETEAPFTLNAARMLSPHGDVTYALEKITSLNESLK